MQKLLHNFRFAIAALFLSAPAFGQTVVINENPTGTSGLIVFGTQTYHASENIYKESEIGASNFTTTPIGKVGFNVATVGANTTFNAVKIYMQNVPLGTATFNTGTYSTAGYTEVFSGSVTLATTGFISFNLTTPFLRTAGTNLKVLIERRDNVTHTGFLYRPSLDDPTNTNPTNTTRRYNGTSDITGATELVASTFRAAISLASVNPIDAAITSITRPDISCYNAPVTFGVTLKNEGTTSIAPGAASVAFGISGANTVALQKANTGSIAAGATEVIIFNNVNIPNPGPNFDSAIVTLAGDVNHVNDTIAGVSLTAPVLDMTGGASLLENAEGAFDVFSYIKVLAGSRNLWMVRNTPYQNADMSAPLAAKSGVGYYYFDSYSGANSAGTSGRLYSNCIKLPGVAPNCSIPLSFFYSQDNIFPNDKDSLFVSVSTDKGLTWTRQNFGVTRYNAAFTSPGWAEGTINLSAYAGQTIQIGFDAVSAYGNVIGLDSITIKSQGCVLPVKLTSFTGVKSGRDNLLQWNTSREVDQYGFDLERSIDGVNFSKIRFVPSAAANGNSANNLAYSYYDRSVPAGNMYYRLKQISKDGKFDYSAIVVIEGEISKRAVLEQIFPTPAKGTLTATFATPNRIGGTLSISSIAGTLIRQQNIDLQPGQNVLKLNVASLSAGTYLITVRFNDNQAPQVVKFIKD